MCHCVCVHVFTRVLMRQTIYKAADLFNPELQYYFQDMATRSSYKKKHLLGLDLSYVKIKMQLNS